MRIPYGCTHWTYAYPVWRAHWTYACPGCRYKGNAYRAGDVHDNVLALMAKASAPVLTDVTVSFPKSKTRMELFPNPVPDLFAGAPLVHPRAPADVA